MAVSVKVFN
ncbi:hypothetical protein MexAM1_META1p2191 [Methylorubrum extorquens AM1]|uniref:Uncharacterized protein n=1 Tax=Methylorubrum extorquens (strain ATCC 14718 / DSM 1338 / JCM 2805 / NCIMB 9133 / AM1) TaxID=272630 RepID=C5APV0_METEA|nr:hypothetical protein MexAM1_META1p2191 [Methylorubrum extorquens AM1]